MDPSTSHVKSMAASRPWCSILARFKTAHFAFLSNLAVQGGRGPISVETLSFPFVGWSLDDSAGQPFPCYAQVWPLLAVSTTDEGSPK